MENIIKIGNIELLEDDVRRLYEDGKYIVAYSKVYQIHYSQPAGFSYSTVYSCTQKGEHLARRGRFHTMTASEVNHLLGFNLLREDL